MRPERSKKCFGDHPPTHTPLPLSEGLDPALVNIKSLILVSAQQDGKTVLCDKRDEAVTYGFCRDLHLTLMFSGL